MCKLLTGCSTVGLAPMCRCVTMLMMLMVIMMIKPMHNSLQRCLA